MHYEIISLIIPSAAEIGNNVRILTVQEAFAQITVLFSVGRPVLTETVNDRSNLSCQTMLFVVVLT